MAPRARTRERRPRRVDYWTLAELRYHIRCFLRGREMAARAIGVEPQQYLLLLQVKGLERRRPATIGVLAERLKVAHHSAVELVDRLVTRGMLVRNKRRPDRREVAVTLTPAGSRVVRKLAMQSVSELRTEGPALVSTLRRLIRSGGGTRRRKGTR